jgi:hypothetical protein
MDVNYNSSSQRVEVVCQIHADDLEMLLSQANRRAIELDRTPGADMLVAAYVMNQVAVRTSSGAPQGLAWIGMEVDRHFATVYLELKAAPGMPLPAAMKNTILLANLPDQFNHVQLKRDGRPVAAPVLFFAGDQWKKLVW